MPPSDYIEYIENLDYYNNLDMVEINSSQNWPLALLGGKIHLNLIHYKTVEEAQNIWNRRKLRIKKDQSYYILVETDGCSYDDLKRFDNLPFKHKVALTHKTYPEISCAYQIKGYEKTGAVIDSYRFHPILPIRKYDQFNWIEFLKHK